MVARLHTFTPTYYAELCPEGHSPNDPRRPRLLYRGPTVEELLALVRVGSQIRASDRAAANEALDQALELAQACTLRAVGDWTWCGLNPVALPSVRSLIPSDALRLVSELTRAGQPEEASDLVPLSDGPTPSA